MDEVLFKLAYLLTPVKKEDQAREFFLRLIKDYPNSKYIPDAYLSFAEYYFDKGEMDARAEVLREGRAVPQVQRLRLRHLQEGLVLLQPGRLQEGARDLRRRRPHGPGGQGQRHAGQKEALEQGSQEGHRQGLRARRAPDKAWEFFQRIGGDFAPKMMEALGELYWEQGKFVESTKVYQK